MSDADDIRVYDRFVSVPEVVLVRYASDDPEFVQPSEDLFHVQKLGLPATFGKKDKITTVQGYFYCVMCECDIKSIVTLRDHCKGTQHKRKELVERGKFNQRIRGTKREHGDDGDVGIGVEEDVKPEVKAERDAELEDRVMGFPREDLPTLFRRMGTPAVGIRHVLEVRATEDGRPMYVCGLSGCKEFSSTADVMYDHVNLLAHQRRFFKETYRDIPETNDMESQVRAEFRHSGYEFDRMERIVNRGRHKRALLRKSASAEGYCVMSFKDEVGSAKVKQEEEEVKREQRRRSRSPRERSRSPQQATRSLPPEVGEEKRPPQEVKRQRRESPPPEPQPQQQQPLQQQQQPQATPEDDGVSPEEKAVKAFNNSMANCVKKVLLKYFGLGTGFPRKIADNASFARVCRELSHEYRALERESHEAQGGRPEDIRMTPDMRNRIELLIDGKFEKMPELPPPPPSQR